DKLFRVDFAFARQKPITSRFQLMGIQLRRKSKYFRKIDRQRPIPQPNPHQRFVVFDPKARDTRLRRALVEWRGQVTAIRKDQLLAGLVDIVEQPERDG